MGAALFLPVVAGLVTALGATMASIRTGGWIGLMIRFSGLALAIFGAMCVAVSVLIFLALSRAREFTADRYAAELTGRPRALASALEAINQAPAEGNLRLGALSGLLFAAPRGFAVSDILVTHPRPAKRVARLLALAGALEETGDERPAGDRGEAFAPMVSPGGTRSEPVAAIVDDLLESPTRSLTMTGIELARRFGSTATQRLPRRVLDRAAAELRAAGVGVAEIGGGPVLLVRLSLVAPALARPSGRRSTAPAFVQAGRPRRLSVGIMGTGLAGGAALGAVILTMVLASGSDNTATAASSSNEGSPSSSSVSASSSDPVARCIASNEITDPPAVTDADVSADEDEIWVTVEWCDDTESYARTIRQATGSGAHSGGGACQAA